MAIILHSAFCNSFFREYNLGSMNILLIGYRGSGKTTVGKIVAGRLRIAFHDADELIVQRAGMDIASIFATQGETEFRDIESQVLEDLLRADGQVLSLGGGIVVREENRRAIAGHGESKVFYLHCDAKVLHQRIVADTKTAAHRPALTPFAGAIAEVEHLLGQRLPLYRQIMTHAIDVTSLSPEQVAEQIVAKCNV